MLKITNDEKGLVDLYDNDVYSLNKTITEVRKMPEKSKKSVEGSEVVLPEFENIIKQIYDIHRG